MKWPRFTPLVTCLLAGCRLAQTTAPELPPADDRLMEHVQRQTFRYFWEFAHPASGMARERSRPNTAEDESPVPFPGEGSDICATGGTGFGIMAILVATERGWIAREQAVERLLKILGFLSTTDRFHGVFPHWVHGATGKTVPFTPRDDGGDLVETSPSSS